MAFGVLDFIDADGPDGSQRAMLQAPSDHVFNRVTDLVPGSTKGFGCFLPRQLAGPAGQKQHVGFGQLVLAVAPRNFLDHHDAATAAVDAPHAVQQEDHKPPEGNELKAPLGKMIVAGRRLVAPRAYRRRALPRSDIHFDTFLVGAEPGVLVDESPMMMAVV